MKTTSMKRESGAVSLFLVIFAMLIITVLTISFIRLMVSDQNQATNNDLSESAYDSAQAGVEDAKRALLNYQQVCSATPGNCGSLRSQLSTDECNEALFVDGIVDPSLAANRGEVKVQQTVSSNDAALDQAYTCVKITMATDEYVGTLTQRESELIPLIGVSSFNTVTVRWFSRDDVTGDAASSLNLPTGPAASQPLLQQSNWPVTRPSVMRSQLIQFGETFSLDSFDSTSSGQSNANTVFLYPTSSGAATNSEAFIAQDIRKSSPTSEPIADSALSTPLPVRCTPNVTAGNYSCQMSLRLPNPIGENDITSITRTSYLRLSAFYNATHFEVLLSNGALDSGATNVVKFRDVQPVIDSTGRANDLFRRIESRVNLYDTGFPYPDATIDVTGDFCKDFGITDTQYIAGSCTP